MSLQNFKDKSISDLSKNNCAKLFQRKPTAINISTSTKHC